MAFGADSENEGDLTVDKAIDEHGSARLLLSSARGVGHIATRFQIKTNSARSPYLQLNRLHFRSLTKVLPVIRVSITQNKGWQIKSQITIIQQEIDKLLVGRLLGWKISAPVPSSETG